MDAITDAMKRNPDAAPRSHMLRRRLRMAALVAALVLGLGLLSGWLLQPQRAGRLLLSLAGGAMALDPGGGAGAGLNLMIGAALCFCSVTLFALGSRLTVTAFPKESPLGRTAVTLTGAAVAILAAAGAQWASGGPAPTFAAWGWPEVGAMLIFSVGALGISQVMWIMSVERLGIGLSALHINAAPFYVMLILFALGSPWNWPQAIAAAVVGLGVLIAQGIVPLPFGARR